MKFHVFGLLLYIAISVYGTHGFRCLIGGYRHFDDIGYYKLYTVSANWNDSQKVCKDDGGYLVVINSQEEYETVRKLQKPFKGDAMYIGIHDFSQEGKYVTVTGKDFVTTDYLKWDVGQPNNANNNEDCVILKDNGLLNDVDCSMAYYFICEHSQCLNNQFMLD